MALLGSMVFDGVVGVIIPAGTKVVVPVENPELILAALRLSGQFQPSSLAYNGWHAASVKAATFALPGTTVTATDETGASHTVLVISVNPHEVPALQAGTLGVWVELQANVHDWPA